MPPRISIRVQIIAATTSLAGLLVIGTMVYRYLESWTWIQSFYFSVVTLCTVGYGDFYPTSDAARLFTACYILVGVAIALSALAILGSSYLARRDERIARRREKRERGSPESQ